jgi:hypothetical protein
MYIKRNTKYCVHQVAIASHLIEGNQTDTANMYIYNEIYIRSVRNIPCGAM